MNEKLIFIQLLLLAFKEGRVLQRNSWSAGLQPQRKRVRIPVALLRLLSNWCPWERNETPYSPAIGWIVPLLFFYKNSFGIDNISAFVGYSNKETKPNLCIPDGFLLVEGPQTPFMVWTCAVVFCLMPLK